MVLAYIIRGLLMPKKLTASLCDEFEMIRDRTQETKVSINVETKTEEEREEIDRAIEAALKTLGYNVSWMPVI